MNQWRTVARYREPDRAAPDGLFRLRLFHAGTAAVAADQTRTPPFSANAGIRLSGSGIRACWHMCWSTSEGGPWPQWGRVSPLNADHLPLYCQSQIFGREGLDLDRSTLADWVGKSTALLEPLADAIHCPAVHVYMHERGAACVGWPSNLCRRHPCRDAGTGQRQDPNRPPLGLRPR